GRAYEPNYPHVDSFSPHRSPPFEFRRALIARPRGCASALPLRNGGAGEGAPLTVIDNSSADASERQIGGPSDAGRCDPQVRRAQRCDDTWRTHREEAMSSQPIWGRSGRTTAALALIAGATTFAPGSAMAASPPPCAALAAGLT